MQVEVLRQQTARAGIERVATQLGPREARPIEDADLNPRAPGAVAANDPGRPATNDDDVVHRAAAPKTRAEFFEPNPRQLQSAAAGRAARPSFGEEIEIAVRVLIGAG